MKYLIIIEPGPNNYSAYIPDLPGCVTVGESIDEVKSNMKEAIDLHLEGLKEDGADIPEPMTLSEYVEA